MMALALVSVRASAIDFSDRSGRDLHGGTKFRSFVAGKSFDILRIEGVATAKSPGVGGELASVGVNIAASVVKYGKTTIRIKGGVQASNIWDGFAIGNRFGAEIEYAFKPNKTFVMEVGNKFNPITRQFSQPTITTGFRFYF